MAKKQVRIYIRYTDGPDQPVTNTPANGRLHEHWVLQVRAKSAKQAYKLVYLQQAAKLSKDGLGIKAIDTDRDHWPWDMPEELFRGES